MCARTKKERGFSVDLIAVQPRRAWRLLARKMPVRDTPVVFRGEKMMLKWGEYVNSGGALVHCRADETRFARELSELVGAIGFEPTTPCAQGRCATRLRYAPTLKF